MPYLLLASLAVFLRGLQAFVRPLVGALSFRRGLRRLADHAPALLAPPCRHRWRGALGRQPAGAGGGRLRGRPGAGRPGPGRPLGSLGDVAAEARRWREGGGASSLGGHAGGPDFQRPFSEETAESVGNPGYSDDFQVSKVISERRPRVRWTAPRVQVMQDVLSGQPSARPAPFRLVSSHLFARRSSFRPFFWLVEPRNLRPHTLNCYRSSAAHAAHVMTPAQCEARSGRGACWRWQM